MAYKFQNGSFSITDDGSSTESLVITGDLDADQANTQTVTADDLVASGVMTADTSISAADVSVYQDGAIADADECLRIQDNAGSPAVLAVAGMANSRAEVSLNKGGGKRVVLHGSDGSNAGGFEIYNDSTQLRHSLVGGKLSMHRDVTMTGDLAITGPGSGGVSNLLIAGSLTVAGNADLDAVAVMINDKNFHINHDAADAPGSDNTVFKIGEGSSANTAQLLFDQGTERLLVQAQNETGTTTDTHSVYANPVGSPLDLTGIVTSLVYAVETTGAPGTVTLSAANHGKVQLLSGNGAYTVNLPASTGLKIGQNFKIKAGANCDDNTKKVTINCNGSDRFGVDGGASAGQGRNQILLESPRAMVELVFLGTISSGGESKATFAIM